MVLLPFYSASVGLIARTMRQFSFVVCCRGRAQADTGSDECGGLDQRKCGESPAGMLRQGCLRIVFCKPRVRALSAPAMPILRWDALQSTNQSCLSGLFRT